MIQIQFSEDDIKALDYERYNHPHPRVQRKMEALWLKSQGLSHREIAKLTGVCQNTLTQYLREYKEGGIEKLKEINFYRPQSDLVDYKSKIEDYFRHHPPASIKEAMGKIEELTGIKRSETQIRKFLKSLGLKRLKIGMIPSKADYQKQEEFKKKELEPRLDEAKSLKRKVFFVDAAHFVLSPYLGYLWCFVRYFIKAPAGRKRFNVLGALDAITHELVMITNETYINAESVCALLWKLYLANNGIAITLVMDNARYQKCRLVQEIAESLNIELLFLPAYSPNLNLIERLWKFIKKKVLYSKYYENFETFKGAIKDCLSKTSNVYKDELDSLLSLKFQTFNNSQVMTF
jgi:transposase